MKLIGTKVSLYWGKLDTVYLTVFIFFNSFFFGEGGRLFFFFLFKILCIIFHIELHSDRNPYRMTVYLSSSNMDFLSSLISTNLYITTNLLLHIIKLTWRPTRAKSHDIKIGIVTFHQLTCGWSHIHEYSCTDILTYREPV